MERELDVVAILRLRIPWILAMSFGLFWSGLYIFLGLMHRMPAMIDVEFPFLLSSFVGIHNGGMHATIGATLAFADAATVAFAMGIILALLHGNHLKGMEE